MIIFGQSGRFADDLTMLFQRRFNLEAPVVPARNAKAMIEAARRIGIGADALLAGTGLCDEALRVPVARITYRAVLSMYRNLMAHPLPADFAFMRGPFSIASYGMLGYAMMSCATVEQAIRIALKYYRTAGPLLDLSFEFDAAGLAITARNVLELDPPTLTLATEELFTPFPLLLELLVGERVAPLRVELAYPPPPHRALYERAFDAPVEFDAPENRYVLDAATLALPLVQADADSAVLFERSCRELLDEIERHESLSNALRQLLLASPGKLPDAAVAATRLRLGERTLRRRLADEGTTFQAILDEVRCRIATDYLTTTHLSTQEIAELLGFSEATNFRRAFLRWTRRSPASFRKQRS
jgi:AraC-like DNA-binding protein